MGKYDPNIHHRRSIRLPGHDYAQPNAYFVTICTHRRECLFGEIRDGEMTLNDAGRIVQSVWDELPKRYPTIETDQFVIMPNHVHGIVWIVDPVGARFIAPGSAGRSEGIRSEGVMNHAPTLGEIIRTFKAYATFLIHKTGCSHFSWQRNYYERIIRSESELSAVRQYIQGNPLKWDLDPENKRSLV